MDKKDYPQYIQEGMLVVCVDDMYEGLAGYIDSTEPDPEGSDNDDLESSVIVDLTETKDMSKTHPDLNGTGVEQLYMGIEELIYFPDGKDQKGYDLQGKTYIFDEILADYPKRVKNNF